MTRISRAHVFALAVASTVLSIAAVADDQHAPGKRSVSSLIQQMAGTWNVQQRMWTGSGAEAITLPPAVARRQLMTGGFLEESMTPAKDSAKASFTRVAYFNYNSATQQYEYFSLDSRAPQMMNERSDKRDPQLTPGTDGVHLAGGSFVAPEWGDAKNVAFTYRLSVGAVEHDTQVVRLYFTPLAGDSLVEFRAFEYVYSRKR